MGLAMLSNVLIFQKSFLIRIHVSLSTSTAPTHRLCVRFYIFKHTSLSHQSIRASFKSGMSMSVRSQWLASASTRTPSRLRPKSTAMIPHTLRIRRRPFQGVSLVDVGDCAITSTFTLVGVVTLRPSRRTVLSGMDGLPEQVQATYAL
ncbi:hypothetical protein PIIN_01824 [Serendipita indica DSM 11827]|uniref:Uncharacterized protein n=1 Tax=Serendipita indica (strain DSM 11827) TaxID=1109443 RepID=G4T9G3_SERID|nr:hypothetical protein PIIN_01824 [Serendipita indica DSM 11827]